MNHLREFLDYIDNNALEFHGGIPDSLEPAIFDAIERHGEQAICFNGGGIEAVCDLQSISALVRLPFPVSWFEFDFEHEGKTVLTGYLCIQRDDLGAIVVIPVSRRNWKWKILPSFSFSSPPDSDGRVQIGTSPNITVPTDDILGLTKPLTAFLSALNCTNIRRRIHEPDPKLQTRRSKRGRKPLFSTWTLEIELTREERAKNMGGSHASPRVHLRRGHARQYAPSKYTWVQPHVVGNKKLGMVHKDYALAPQEAHP